MISYQRSHSAYQACVAQWIKTQHGASTCRLSVMVSYLTRDMLLSSCLWKKNRIFCSRNNCEIRDQRPNVLQGTPRHCYAVFFLQWGSVPCWLTRLPHRCHLDTVKVLLQELRQKRLWSQLFGPTAENDQKQARKWGLHGWHKRLTHILETTKNLPFLQCVGEERPPWRN